jgi:phosphate-selective porin OprO/OprP
VRAAVLALAAAVIIGDRAQAIEVELGGRLLLDYAEQDIRSGDPDVRSRTITDRYVRAARLKAEGELNERWSFAVEADVRDGGPQVNFQDVYLRYQASEAVALRLGAFRTVSLEGLTSLNHLTFMNRGAFADLIQGDRTSALELQWSGDRWRLSAAAISDNINEADDDEDSRGWTVRAAWAPKVEALDVAHLGAWARARDAGSGAYRYSARSNASIGPRLTDSGSRFQSDRTVGVEAAVVRGPVSLQAEHAWLEAERAGGGPDGTTAGWYAFASWFVTGERRRYEDTAFTAPSIRRPVTKGGPGAFELALRRDEADVSDLALGPATPRAGRYLAWTAGATWYPVKGFRFMANYTLGEHEAPGGSIDADTLQVRAQYNF